MESSGVLANDEKDGFCTSDSLDLPNAAQDKLKDPPPLVSIRGKSLPKEGFSATTEVRASIQSAFETAFAFGLHSEAMEGQGDGNNRAANDDREHKASSTCDSGQITLLQCSQCNYKAPHAKKLKTIN